MVQKKNHLGLDIELHFPSHRRSYFLRKGNCLLLKMQRCIEGNKSCKKRHCLYYIQTCRNSTPTQIRKKQPNQNMYNPDEKYVKMNMYIFRLFPIISISQKIFFIFFPHNGKNRNRQKSNLLP